MTIPRKHHYVPKLYLKGFSSDGTKSGTLHVHDLESNRQWESSPEKAACERDFYALEAAGEGAGALEKFLGDIENLVAPVILEIIQSGKIPSGKEYEYLINFLATLAVRSPSNLNRQDHFYKDTADSRVKCDSRVSMPHD
jgi:hypothetical protein